MLVIIARVFVIKSHRIAHIVVCRSAAGAATFATLARPRAVVALPCDKTRRKVIDRQLREVCSLMISLSAQDSDVEPGGLGVDER